MGNWDHLQVRSPSSPKMSSPKWAHLPTENWGHLQVWSPSSPKMSSPKWGSPSSPNWAHPDELTEITCHLNLCLIKTYFSMFISNVAMVIIWNFDFYIRGEYFFLIIFCKWGGFSHFWFFLIRKNSDPCLKLYIKGGRTIVASVLSQTFVQIGCI